MGIEKVIKEMEDIVYQGISREEILLMNRLLADMKQNILNSKDFKGVDMETIMEKTHHQMKNMKEKIPYKIKKDVERIDIRYGKITKISETICRCCCGDYLYIGCAGLL